jgi:hypothetical protein
MRYLKQRNLSRRIANDTTLYSDAANSNVYVAPVGQGSFALPAGPTTNQPGQSGNTASPVVGMMRYDTTTNQVMVYQGSAWRALRYKESTQITQQNLGAGDSTQIYFGPLNPSPPSQVQTGATWGGQNIIIVVENVMQISGINYTVVQNPTIGADSSAVGTLSVAGTTSSKTLYFNTSLNVISASWSGSVATLTLLNTSSTGVPFATGSTITVTGISPSGYNGVYTVTGGTATTVTYALVSNPGTFQYAGTVTASGTTPAIFASLDNLVGANVTGTGIAGSSTVVSYTTDPNTDALTSITMNNFPSSSIAVNTVSITIGETSTTGSGYYLQFTEPVPYGKVVIALIGFDQ